MSDRFRPLAVLLCGGALLAGGCDRAGDGAAVPPEPPAAAEPAVGFPAGPYFEDATDALGVDFARFDGRAPGPGGTIADGRRMYEWTGGGVAAFDLDADGRPDLALTQGREWGPRNDPPSSDPDPAAPYRDALFRNVGGRFEDVTGPAGFLSTGFGQGAAAGDWDGDGFADLYVCNIGGNRLLRNEGDGTFTDVTEHAGLNEGANVATEDGGAAAAWTVSAAMADLNADGLPDLYDANYVHGDAFTEACEGRGGVRRVCAPGNFPATADRLLVNLGDGRFADVSEAAGLPSEGDGTDPGDGAGPAMGLVAADLDGAAGTEVFVAVDQRPNHALVPADAGKSGGIPRLRRAGRASGLATAGSDEYACMGVACGDADADGRPDLFVTNYADQPNTLYRNASGPGGPLFEDGTAAAGLYDPGFPTLGFGAQFLDADRDGDPDLAYLNGHLDDFTHAGAAFRMKPAFFLNDGGGRFAEVPAGVAGPFFGRPDLGRALARLDADGDGRDDLAAAHLGGPARLLRNVFAGGAGVGLRVADPAGDRDAVGAAVTVTAPTAGGGAPPARGACSSPPGTGTPPATSGC